MSQISPLELVILALAVYRLASMVTQESGPFWMFRKLRSAVKKEAPKKTHMDEGISCPLCMSMQFAIAIVVLRYFVAGNPIFDMSMLALALSGASVLLVKFTSKS